MKLKIVKRKKISNHMKLYYMFLLGGISACSGLGFLGLMSIAPINAMYMGFLSHMFTATIMILMLSVYYRLVGEWNFTIPIPFKLKWVDDEDEEQE